MDQTNDALHGLRYHSREASDAANVASWVPADQRDYLIVEALKQAALMADDVSRIRAIRPDLATRADDAATKWRSREAAQRIEKARAHG